MHALPEFTLHRAATWADAAAALAATPGARVLAGGTDLLPNLRRGLGVAPVLVALDSIADYAALVQDAPGRWTLGAGVTLAALARSPALARAVPALTEAARSVAAGAHRSAGTLGGNLCQDTRCVHYNQGTWWRGAEGGCLKTGGGRCHVAPQGQRCHAASCSDLAPVLLVLDAQVQLVSAEGARWVPLASLYREDGKAPLTLQAGELLARVRFAAPPPGWHSAFGKARLRDGIDFPLAAVAVAAEFGNGHLARLEVAISGTNSAPLLLEDTGALLGQPVNDGLLEQLGKLVQRQVTPMRSTSAPAHYRRQVASVLAQRLVLRCAREAGHGA